MDTPIASSPPRTADRARALAFALLIAAPLARAADEPPRHRGPPPEALQACKDKKAEQACTFDGRRGNVEGTCFAPPDRPLACRPAGAPDHPPRDGQPAPRDGEQAPR